MIKGYARVSTDGQDLATQYELLKAVGAELIYSEKQPGVKTDRAALARLMASLEPGDTVLVRKLDRLAHGKLMLTVLGGLAEFERHLILARTSEGRVRAKARGVRFGRRPKLTKHQQYEALARWEAGDPCRDSQEL